ncbi:MAG: NADP-dependent phosphogluconate dehydrogenase [Planctomycetota bacterium]
MSSDKFDFGMVGLGVMGRNFALNVADNGFSVIGMDTDQEKASALESESEKGNVKGTTQVEEFVASLSTPRRIMLLVPAGKIVDAVIESLLPHLEKDDLVMDGGNSFFEDTDRRIKYLNEQGIRYFGVGVSGGAEGARRGPSIMPGGNREAYESVQKILEAVSAKVGKDPCVDFMGHQSAGNYVKMVHNGIEYALMQILSEAYDLLKRIGGLSNAQLHEVFDQWNQTELQSFLVEITADIFAQPDDQGDGDLIDKILDKAKQKGTGKWTSQHAMDLGVPVPTIDSAVTMRGISSFKQQRVSASQHFGLETGNVPVLSDSDRKAFVEEVKRSVLFAFIVSYSQGLSLLAEASEERGYEIDLERCAKIWRGGCIIRAALLEDIRKAFSQDTHLRHLILSPVVKGRLIDAQAACRKVLKAALDHSVPALTIGSALNYFDAFRSERLPLNLVQAQRDFFGSHTYERIDQEGVFHTEWNSKEVAAE